MAGLEDLTPDERKAFNLGRLLLGNPEVRRESLRLAKKADPKLNLPEIEFEEQLNQVNEAAIKREQKLADDLMSERVARRQADRNRQIVEAGYKVEDIEAIIVREKCTYETAMKIADLEARTADPGPADVQHGHAVGTPVEMRPEGDWRKLNGAGLRKRSAQIAGEMINNFRGRRPARA